MLPEPIVYKSRISGYDRADATNFNYTDLWYDNISREPSLHLSDDEEAMEVEDQWDSWTAEVDLRKFVADVILSVLK